MIDKARILKEAHANARANFGRGVYRENLAWFLKMAWAAAKRAAAEALAMLKAPKEFAALKALKETYDFRQIADDFFFSSGRAAAHSDDIARAETALAAALAR